MTAGLEGISGRPQTFDGGPLTPYPGAHAAGPSDRLCLRADSLAVAGMALVVSLHPWNWKASALVRMQPDEPMAALARRIDPGFVLIPHGHYDGVYAFAIATDPLARGAAHELIDRAAYRYGRAGQGWLGWILSGGRPRAVPAALIAISLAGMAIAGTFASLLSSLLGFTPWGGLVVVFNPGFLIGVTSDTSEPLPAALLAVGCTWWFRRRLLGAGLALAYLCLVKEQISLSFPPGCSYGS